MKEKTSEPGKEPHRPTNDQCKSNTLKKQSAERLIQVADLVPIHIMKQIYRDRADGQSRAADSKN
jgi:hypothetical protein